MALPLILASPRAVMKALRTHSSRTTRILSNFSANTNNLPFTVSNANPEYSPRCAHRWRLDS